jgi:hypothetical protein
MPDDSSTHPRWGSGIGVHAIAFQRLIELEELAGLVSKQPIFFQFFIFFLFLVTIRMRR